MGLVRKSVCGAVGTTIGPWVTAGAGENIVITSLILGNIDGTNNATVDIGITKSGGSLAYIVKKVPIYAGEAVQLFIGGKDGIFLETGDVLSGLASAAGDVSATISYIIET